MRAKTIIALFLVWLGFFTVFVLASTITTLLNLTFYALLFQSLLILTALSPVALLAITAYLAIRRYLAHLQRDEIIDSDIPISIRTAKQLTIDDYYALTELRYRRSSALPAPIVVDAGVGVEALTSWLYDAGAEAHILIAGKTGSGKTTVASALLAVRVDAGDTVAVIDPHYQAGKWHNLPAIGAGRNYAEISSALSALEREMTARYQRMAEGQSVGPAITIVIDETPAIASECAEWRRIATRLGSEARKAGIRLILISQSPLVEDLSLNSVMRRNYSIIALDLPTARLLLRDVSDADKGKIIDTLSQQRWPAIGEINGAIRLLDRAGIERVYPQKTPTVWQPELPQLTDKQGERDRQTKIELLKELVRQGVKREQARKIIAFDNNEWALARKQVDQEG